MSNTLPSDFAKQQRQDRTTYLLPQIAPGTLVDVCTLTEAQEVALDENPDSATRGTTIARGVRYESAVLLAEKTSTQYLQVVFYKPNTRTVVESH